MQIPQLETERLFLRGFYPADLDAYAEMCADPEVMRYLGYSQPLTRSEAWRNMAMILGHWHLRGYGMWAVEQRCSGTLIGRIGCWQPEGWPGFEIGWSLRRAYWGQGYATEGARAAMNHAFFELKQSHVISVIHPENAASIRVAQKLGEKLEGTTQLLGCEVLVYGIHQQGWQST